MDFVLIIILALVTLVSFAVGQGTNDLAALATVVFFPCAAALYFAPAIVAFRRHHPSAKSIAILDLLLGWSVLGWVGALVWAYSPARPTVAQAEPVANEDASSMKACPFCAERIRAEAVKCRFCGSDVAGAAAAG